MRTPFSQHDVTARILKNESGIILITVILLTVVLSVLVVSIMGVNVGQVRTGRGIVESIAAEQLAVGAFYQYHQKQSQSGNCPTCAVPTDCSSCPDAGNETLNGKAFAVTVTNNGNGGNPPDIVDPEEIEVQVDY